jgi:hypothetical protein
MRLESARALKAEMLASTVVPDAAVRIATRSAAAAAPALPEVAARRPLAFGIRGRGKDYELAVRVQAAMPGVDAILEDVRRRARGEVHVRHVGRVVKQAAWHRRRNRPLQIGGSIGHAKHDMAGTLGAFVTRGSGREDFILSNNHVLADENRAKRGDRILQPGRLDGGRAADLVGFLGPYVRLRLRGNRVDAAIASLAADVEYYSSWIEGRGGIAGVRDEPLETGTIVYKVGRTTGLRRGRIEAIELDDLVVGDYYAGDLVFDDQIEIAPAGPPNPFSRGGDSGSLIVDARHRAVGLLFAGNDTTATYANPIERVLSDLGVRLVH